MKCSLLDENAFVNRQVWKKVLQVERRVCTRTGSCDLFQEWKLFLWWSRAYIGDITERSLALITSPPTVLLSFTALSESYLLGIDNREVLTFGI